jgi:hypothetical protein
MIVFGFICKKCKTFVFSRTRHDFRTCKCKEDTSYIDGGQDNEYGGGYSRIGGFPENIIFGVKMEIDSSAKELFQDWNLEVDHFGHIPVTDEDIEKWEKLKPAKSS